VKARNGNDPERLRGAEAPGDPGSGPASLLITIGDRGRPAAADALDDVGDDVEQALPRGAAKAGRRLRGQRRPAVADRAGDDLLVGHRLVAHAAAGHLAEHGRHLLVGHRGRAGDVEQAFGVPAVGQRRGAASARYAGQAAPRRHSPRSSTRPPSLSRAPPHRHTHRGPAPPPTDTGPHGRRNIGHAHAECRMAPASLEV